MLVQENLIETIKNKIDNLEKESASFNKNKKGKLLPFLPLIIGVLSPIIMVPIFLNFLTTSGSNAIINTVFGTIKIGYLFTGMMIPITTLVGTIFSLNFYNDYKEGIKIERGRNNVIKQLKLNLKEETQKLKNIKKAKVFSITEDIQTLQVNDKEVMDKLKRSINFYYDCGYNGTKYYKYYRKTGKIPCELNRIYDEAEQQNLINYLAAKGPQLIKKRNIKK